MTDFTERNFHYPMKYRFVKIIVLIITVTSARVVNGINISACIGSSLLTDKEYSESISKGGLDIDFVYQYGIDVSTIFYASQPFIYFGFENGWSNDTIINGTDQLNIDVSMKNYVFRIGSRIIIDSINIQSLDGLFFVGAGVELIKSSLTIETTNQLTHNTTIDKESGSTVGFFALTGCMLFINNHIYIASEIIAVGAKDYPDEYSVNNISPTNIGITFSFGYYL